MYVTGKSGDRTVRVLHVAYRVLGVCAVLTVVLFGLRLLVSQTAYYYVFPYPPPWWARAVLWLL